MIKQYLEQGKPLYEVRAYVKDKQRNQLSRCKRGITSERKAKDIEFKFRCELLRIAERHSSWTWATWFTECLNRMRLSRCTSTVIQYEGRLTKWVPKDWQTKLITEITFRDVAETVNALPEDVSPHSRKTIYKLIKRVFELACEEGIIVKNPAIGLNIEVSPVEGKVLNSTEAQMLITCGREADHRFFPVWVLALFSGMRSGEMYALRWADIDLETNLIALNKQWTSKVGIKGPKWNSARMVPISADLNDFLRDYRAKRPGFTKTLWDSQLKCEVTFNDYLLPNLREWDHGMQASVLADFCRGIGITVIKFHDLRATFITNLLNQGVPLTKVMKIVGHRKLSTTDKYNRRAGVDVKDATEALGYSVQIDSVQKSVLAFQSSFNNQI
jgi:integrase